MSAATSSISDSVDEEKLNDFKLYCTMMEEPAEELPYDDDYDV